jgi:Fe-S cluster assembly protein SufD
MSALAPTLPRLLERFPEAVDAWRQRARKIFIEQGMPTGREEAWRSTPVRALRDGDFRQAPDWNNAALPEPWASLIETALIFVDGRLLSRGKDVPASLSVWSKPGSDSSFRETNEPLAAANAALFTDAAHVRVTDGEEIEPTLLIVHLTAAPDDCAVFPRTRIELGRGARATVIECYASLEGGKGWTNSVTEAHVAENASLQYIRFQDIDPGAPITGSLLLHQKRDSRIETLNVDIGASLGRLHSEAILDGEGCWCRLDGLVLTEGTQHLDNHTVLDHAKPHGDSREVYKSILSGKSRSVFSGRIIVREDAQKTDAKQSNPNLLLSDSALAHTRPQLEIYADDVKCTHGATVGQLDDSAEFYLRTRGIPQSEARSMLVRAFAGEILDALPEGPINDRVRERVEQKLDVMTHGS